MASFLSSILAGLLFFVIFALFRRYAPRSLNAEATEDNGKRLPYGVAGAIMWAIGIVVAAGGFFLLDGVNRLWASFDKGSNLTIYPPWVLWCFAPAVAALLIPYLATLWLLRRFDYAGQAADIVAQGNAKINVNGERVMHGLGWFVVLPILLATIPELPAHLSVQKGMVRVTHYGHVKPDVYALADAKKAWWVDGYALRDGSFQSRPDLLIDFADGRRFHATAMSDGGDPPPQQLVNLLLARTHLEPMHVHTEDDAPIDK